jgi:hypothetical protein
MSNNAISAQPVASAAATDSESQRDEWLRERERETHLRAAVHLSSRLKLYLIVLPSILSCSTLYGSSKGGEWLYAMSRALAKSANS